MMATFNKGDTPCLQQGRPPLPFFEALFATPRALGHHEALANDNEGIHYYGSGPSPHVTSQRPCLLLSGKAMERAAFEA